MKVLSQIVMRLRKWRQPAPQNIETDVSTTEADTPVEDENVVESTILLDGYGLVFYYGREQKQQIHAVPLPEAVGLVRASTPALVVCNADVLRFTMPEFVSIVRKDMSIAHIPIVVVASQADLSARVEALKAGADDYLVKPISDVYLRARILNLIEQRLLLTQGHHNRLLLMDPQALSEQENNDAFMTRLMNYMEQQMDNNELTVDEVVEHMNLGRTVFFNRLKTLTGLSPVEFIREVRVKRAAQLLRTGTYNVAEVAYMIGMNDSRYFSKCFKTTFGITPSDFKRTNSQE